MAGDMFQSNHLTFLNFSSINKLSISFQKTCFVNSLPGILLGIKIIFPPLFLFPSNLQSTENPVNKH